MMMTSHIHNMHSDNSQQIQSPQSIADYLAQLLKDRKQLAALPNVFTHLERLLDEGEFLQSFLKTKMNKISHDDVVNEWVWTNCDEIREETTD